MNTLARWARHIWLDAADTRRLLGAAGLQRLEQAVRDSEARHMGELRVCVEAGLSAGALWRGISSRARAIELFSQLRVWDTEHNNGVLIYLLLAERRIEILADRGLHIRTDSAVWHGITQQLSASLQSGQYEAGLTQAITAVSELLRQHFPLSGRPNPNELPDAVVLI
ncbi:membrane protein [Aquabacterium sp. NJ1]|uniref:TPM domain-containing protein n=1 Tax=Aquabacterium sp. NJ1 TaxID=1538295 RepID=UPI00052DFE23|nr:TPM domain-containing protein [Aquabacterium sp. NJ1]KGM39689.1 membrane protein [Aquabacterium sp. NJ1]